MTAADIIAQALTPVPGIEPVAHQVGQAAAVVAALTSAGFVILAPQDIEWGECPGHVTDAEGLEHGPHHVSLSLCTYCLEYDPS